VKTQDPGSVLSQMRVEIDEFWQYSRPVYPDETLREGNLANAWMYFNIWKLQEFE